VAWSNSKLFRQYLADVIENTTAIDWSGDASIKAALYDNDITPDNDVSAANSAYNAGQWVITGNEVIDSTGGGTDWPAGGVNLASRTVNVGSADVVFLDANDTASGTTADIAGAYGCLVYADTIAAPVADQGICYNYFGGSNSVTNGTFTIVWSANGVVRFTL
jgi:hypothetical protein